MTAGRRFLKESLLTERKFKQGCSNIAARLDGVEKKLDQLVESDKKVHKAYEKK